MICEVERASGEVYEQLKVFVLLLEIMFSTSPPPYVTCIQNGLPNVPSSLSVQSTTCQNCQLNRTDFVIRPSPKPGRTASDPAVSLIDLNNAFFPLTHPHYSELFQLGSNEQLISGRGGLVTSLGGLPFTSTNFFPIGLNITAEVWKWKCRCTPRKK
jgi:hypothetical protein